MEKKQQTLVTPGRDFNPNTKVIFVRPDRVRMEKAKKADNRRRNKEARKTRKAQRKR